MQDFDNSIDDNRVDFNEAPNPAGQEGFDMNAQREEFLGGGGQAESGKPRERLSKEDAEAKVGTFLQFAKQVDADRAPQALGEKIGDVVDKLYFQQEPPPKQSPLARFLGRQPGQQVDMAAHRQRDLVEALQQDPSRAKVAFLKEVMPKFRSLGGGGLVEDFTKVIDYDFDSGTPRPAEQPSQEPMSDEQAHAQVEAFLASVRERDAHKGDVAGRGLAPDVSVTIDKTLQAEPHVRSDMDSSLQRQGLSAMKAQILMKVVHNYSPSLKGGIDGDLAKIIDYKPAVQQPKS